jgi:hypothetical protein
MNFLDIRTNRDNNKLSYKIYRKSTVTSTTHNTSCHPHENKIAAFNYLYNRVNTYLLTQNNIKHEINTLKQIAYENGYKDVTVRKQHMKLILETTDGTDKQQTKWVTFTYIGKKNRFIKLYKNTNLKIA